MKIKKLLLFTSMFVVLSCSEKQVWQEIETGKTIKVFPESLKSKDSNYVYKWSKPIGPEGAKFEYSIENDKLLLTALTVGEYYISVEVENRTNEKIHEEKFYFNAIKGNFELTEKKSEEIIPTKKEPEKVKKSEISNKKAKNKNRFTIQVASWTSLEKAKEDMSELIELGFDTYIEEYFDKKNNIQRWRVRIGSFKSKDLAKQVKEQLSKFRGESPWIAYIK